MTKKVLGVIPARYASTRFPAKPLAQIGNKSMIEWTYIHAKAATCLDHLVVATDNEEIENAVLKFGGNVVMTSVDHQTGTDRLIEVCQQLSDYQIIVNIQGDEPGIERELIDGIVALKQKHPNWEMTTAAVPFLSTEDPKDPNRVKVVFDRNGKANYFSRSPIPASFKNNADYFRHLGIYCYERDFLLSYQDLPKSTWEASESLEQLRAMQAGKTIGVFSASKASLGVDTPEDLEIVRADFKKRGLLN
ncbi:MAG: 3-deoxy-manno-octulosonate cytidylyltransferase [Leptospira sp.]|nr:3-deoxy-manno-octulosonate cytidylyltransferase [Leptospira sp.]